MKFKKNVAGLLAVTMFTGAVTPATPVFASEKIVSSYQGIVTDNGYEFTQEDIESIIPVLETIEQIPDELLESGTHDEISRFCREHGTALNIYNDNIGETQKSIIIRSSRKSAAKCALAIGQLIVTVGLPATQITKIKKYIKALGGVAEAAKLLVGATTVSEKSAGILSALGTILATITGVDGIKEHCFG